ncbi:hypothetical protein KBC03_04850 [Patescibacteria group bacterium]|nr:hypothetical protein [Patescibacteria group bacterium]
MSNAYDRTLKLNRMKKLFITIAAFATLSAITDSLTAAGKTDASISQTIEAYGRVHYPDQYTDAASEDVQAVMDNLDEDDNGISMSVDDEGNLTITSAHSDDQAADVTMSDDAGAGDAVTALFATAAEETTEATSAEVNEPETAEAAIPDGDATTEA